MQPWIKPANSNVMKRRVTSTKSRKNGGAVQVNGWKNPRYDEENFPARDFSRVQMYLSSIKKYSQIHPIVHWGDKTASTVEQKAKVTSRAFSLNITQVLVTLKYTPRFVKQTGNFLKKNPDSSRWASNKKSKRNIRYWQPCPEENYLVSKQITALDLKYNFEPSHSIL